MSKPANSEARVGDTATGVRKFRKMELVMPWRQANAILRQESCFWEHQLQSVGVAADTNRRLQVTAPRVKNG